MPPLRICHVITQLELGGAQQNTLYTVAHLDRRRFAPSLIAGPGGILDAEARALSDLPFFTCPSLVREIAPWRDLRALIWLTRTLRQIAPDVVHTHSSKAGVLGRLAAFLAGVPIIVHTVHGWGFHPAQSRLKRRAFIVLEKFASLVTTHWIAVSQANAISGANERIVSAETFEIIHSGIELERFRRAADSGKLRTELGLGPATPLAGMVACLKPQKAPLDFVAVAERVARAVPDAHFVLAGDGVLREAVEQSVAHAGLGSHFHLLGWRRDPETIVGDLDVLVLTSLHEGLPRVVPEAMAAGRAVVATAVDGTPEAVVEGETGFLHPAGDIQGLAASTIALLSDRGRARRCGELGHSRAVAWDIDAMVRQQERMYWRLAEERGLAR